MYQLYITHFNWHKDLITTLDLFLSKETNTNFEMEFDIKISQSLLINFGDYQNIVNKWVNYTSFKSLSVIVLFSVLFFSSKPYDKICSNDVGTVSINKVCCSHLRYMYCGFTDKLMPFIFIHCFV